MRSPYKILSEVSIPQDTDNYITYFVTNCKKSTKLMIGDIGYVFRKEFGSQGWFTGTVVKIMKDGDRRCKYSDGDVEDLLLDDLVQLARLDTLSNSTEEKKTPIAEKFQPDVKCRSIATTKTKRKKCNVQGRKNNVQKGGVHITHRAKVKQCSYEGCANKVQNGGVCVTHGAKKKHCGHKGCTNKVVQGGVCITHGAMTKRCSFKGCANRVFKGGVCITHGAMKTRCSSKGCTNKVVQGGVCVTHGAMTKRCSFEGCTNRVIKGGVCITHGAKVERKRCSFEGCTSHAQKGGVCWRHSSKRIKANNNPTIQSTAVTSAIPPHLPMNYEDEEEELNSWIWRSSRRQDMLH